MGEKRIKAMYNDAAKAFNEYMKKNDIAQFTENAAAICKKYNHESDVCNLMIWWSARVNGIHEQYLGGIK